MKLKLPISVQDFYEGLVFSEMPEMFSLTLKDFLLQNNPEPYGLQLMRQAILEYEKEHDIPQEKSKSKMPFYLNHQFRFVGMDMTPFVISLYESPKKYKENEPYILLSLDSEELINHCLNENYLVFRCKYDKKANIAQTTELLELEYDQFFFTHDTIGFSPKSRFNTILCNAALGYCDPKQKTQKEWRIAVMRNNDEIDFLPSDKGIIPSVKIDIPFDCITGIEITPDYKQYPELYTVMIGLMDKFGLKPDKLLTGMIE